MESLWLLIPLSAGLVLLIIAVFAWALHRGQFEDLEREGERILEADGQRVDGDQEVPGMRTEKSSGIPKTLA